MIVRSPLMDSLQTPSTSPALHGEPQPHEDRNDDEKCGHGCASTKTILSETVSTI